MANVLIVEDDPDIASLLRRGLGAAGHTVTIASCVGSAETALGAASHDAAIIDMMLGEDSGADLLMRMRRHGHAMPALMLSALSRVEERATGLRAGAQDYVVKPFQFGELLARLEVQLCRARAPAARITLGGLTWDPVSRRVTGGARPVVLTEREGELLGHLLAHAGQVLSRGEIFDALWAGGGSSTDNVVDVYIGYLRRKLGNFAAHGLVLRTLRGRGFTLALAETEEEDET